MIDSFQSDDIESRRNINESSSPISTLNDESQDDQNNQSIDSNKNEKEIIWVEFEKDDPENPFNFSLTRKWSITILASLITVEVSSAAGAYVQGLPSMQKDFRESNDEVALLGISIYALGFGIFPLFLAPFSESIGRNPIYILTQFGFTIFFIGTGFVNNITGMLILRFIQGGFGSTGSTMVGGSLADIWHSKDRGLPMSLFAFAAIFGTGFGPFFGGLIENNNSLKWRWIQYIQAIYCGIISFIVLFVLKETRGSVILSKRAKLLRKQTGNLNYKSKSELERQSLLILIKQSLTRPIWMLFTEPIVFSFSLWVSFVWGFMYMLLESIGLITDLHNYNSAQNGLIFLSISLGGFIGFLLNFLQEKIYEKRFPIKGPEARLYCACIAAIVFPIGCFIYGWTSFSKISIAGPIIGITLVMSAVYTIYLAVFNYLADAYLIYASSAIAGQSFVRNLAGFAFPLFVKPMYKNLGYQWASSLAGFLGALCGLVAFILFFFGKKIRSKSKFSLELQKLYKEQDQQVEKQKENQEQV